MADGSDAMGVREYARGRGVSQPYISQLIGAGRILKNPETGKISKAQADSVLDTVRLKADGKRMRRELALKPAADPGTPVAPQHTPTGAYTTARAVLETTRAKIEQLNYRQRVNELVETEAVRRGVADSIGPIVRELRGMPDRLAAQAAAETDPRRTRELLSGEVESTIARIAAAVAALGEGTGATVQ